MRAPSHIGPYQVLAELGRGGMGVVYRAFDPNLKREVAIKTIVCGSEAVDLLRFLREAQVLGQLRHPGIASVHSVVREGPGAPYIVMDLVPGPSLHQVCRESPLAEGRAVEVVAGLCDGLAHAHERGIVHRDLKPQNVILRPDGQPVLLDFGLARLVDRRSRALTESGTVLGTPAYMAPEQALGQEAGVAADVYGLGALLYACLTGSSPFPGTALMEVLDAVVSTPPRPPSELRPGLHSDLEAICLRCLEKDPARRYPSASALAHDLKRFLGGESLEPRPRGRRSAALAGSALGVVLILALALVLGWSRSDPGDPARDARAALAELRTVLGYRYEPLGSGREEVERVARARASAAAIVSRLRLAVAQRSSLPELHVIEGRAHLALDDYGEAVACAGRALALDETHGPAWLLKSRGLIARFALDVLSRFVAPDEKLGWLKDARGAMARAIALGERAERMDEVWERITRAAVNMYAKQERVEEVRRAAEALRTVETSERTAYAAAVLALLRAGKVDPGVVKHLDAALARCPRSLPALCLRGRARYLSQDLPGALSDLSAAIRIQPSYAGAHFFRALAHWERRDHALARADASRAIALKPDFALAYAVRGALQLQRGDNRAARRDCEQALRGYLPDTERAKALANLGQARRRLGDIRGSLADFDAALRLKPEWAFVHLKRGQSRGALNDLRGAIADYTRAIHLDPDLADAYLERGTLHGHQRRLRAALADFAELVRRRPGNTVGWFRLAQAKRDTGDIAGARADIERALQTTPRGFESQLAMGQALLSRRRFQEAERHLSRAIASNPRIAEPWQFRGMARRHQRKTAGALADFNEAIRLDPKRSQAFVERGVVRTQQNHPQAAIQDFTRAIALDARNADAYLKRGAVLRVLKRHRAAGQDLELSAQLAPKVAEVWAELGHLKVALQDYPGALADYDRSVKIKPLSRVFRNRAAIKKARQDLKGAGLDLEQSLRIKPNQERAAILRRAIRAWLGRESRY